MKAKHIQPLTITLIILAGLLFVRYFLPKPDANAGLIVQSGSTPMGLSK